MVDGSQQEDTPRISDLGLLIDEKSNDIVEILIGQKLKTIRMILGQVESKISELYLVN